jgi:hypothetical protein
MSNQKDRSIYLTDHLLRTFCVVSERRQGILHRVEGVTATSIQPHDDLAPMGGTTPEAMDENDVGLAGHAYLHSGRAIGSPTSRAVRLGC